MRERLIRVSIPDQRLELLEGGRKFEVSGCMGPICKKQVWTREN